MANNPIDDDSDSSDLYDLTPGIEAEEMPEKTSQRQLFIRRYIEDRLEQKRLEELSDENIGIVLSLS